jgi:hypothetical protein
MNGVKHCKGLPLRAECEINERSTLPGGYFSVDCLPAHRRLSRLGGACYRYFFGCRAGVRKCAEESGTYSHSPWEAPAHTGLASGAPVMLAGARQTAVNVPGNRHLSWRKPSMSSRAIYGLIKDNLTIDTNLFYKRFTARWMVMFIFCN